MLGRSTSPAPRRTGQGFGEFELRSWEQWDVGGWGGGVHLIMHGIFTLSALLSCVALTRCALSSSDRRAVIDSLLDSIFEYWSMQIIRGAKPEARPAQPAIHPASQSVNRPTNQSRYDELDYRRGELATRLEIKLLSGASWRPEKPSQRSHLLPPDRSSLN